MTNGSMSFDVRTPDNMEAGAYANLLAVWHTVFEFTFDFSVTLPVEQHADTGAAVIPTRIVARVKVPPTIVFQMLQAISENLTGYESQFGPIRRPGDADPLPFPDDLMG